MEENNENQVPNEPVVNPAPQNPNPAPSGTQKPPKKKKKMGAFGGFCIAILIVFLIAVIALLARMVIVGDGDYFKPIKQVFGLEEEKEVKKKSSKKNKEEKEENKQQGNKTDRKSNQLSKVKDEAYADGVDHYRLSMDIQDLLEMYQEMEESGEADEVMEALPGIVSLNNKNNNVKATYLTDVTLDASLDSSLDSSLDAELDSDYGSLVDSLLGDEEMMELVAGEFYIDIFAKNNELVQAVIGLDMLDYFDNLYDYMAEENPESVEEFEDGYDLADYFNKTIKSIITEDSIVDMLVEEMDVEGIDLTQKQLRDMLDISLKPGVYEFYINGTVALNDLLGDFLDENQNDMIESAEVYGIDYDGSNFFEVAVELYNQEFEEMGYDNFEFELVD